MSDSEWLQLVEQIRQRVRDHCAPIGTEDQGAFAVRAGVSRPMIANFIHGRRTPAHEFMGQIVEALGLRIVEVAQGLSPSQSIVGTIDGSGVILFSHEERMGRFTLVQDVSDHEKPIARGSILVTEHASDPVPGKWNLIETAGRARLARCYATSGGLLIRFAGERVRQEWTPEEHRMIGFVAWSLAPAD